MADSRLFPAKIIAQLCYPAALVVFVGMYKGGVSEPDWYLLLFSLYVCLPHLLVALIGLWPSVRRSTIFFTLVALNALATLFCVAFAFSTDPNAGLIFALYPPAWIVILVLAPQVAVDTRRK